VNDRRDLLLGVIAVATLAIALVQVGIIVYAGLAARRVSRLLDRLDRDLAPLIGHLNAIGRDAARAAALASAQVERADKLFDDVAVRLDQTLSSLQATLSAPAREGRALLSALRAAFQALRELRHNGPRQRSRAEEEDALFI